MIPCHPSPRMNALLSVARSNPLSPSLSSLQSNTSDPYVEVSVGSPKQMERTTTMKWTRDPIWDEELLFSGPEGFLEATGDEVSDVLLLQVFDWDSALKAPFKALAGKRRDDFLGEVRVHLQQAFEQAGEDIEYTEPLVLRNGKARGTLRFTVTWRPAEKPKRTVMQEHVLPIGDGGNGGRILPIIRDGQLSLPDGLLRGARGWTLMQDLAGAHQKLLLQLQGTKEGPTEAELLASPLSLRVRAKVIVGGWSPWSKRSGRVQMPLLPPEPVALRAEPLGSKALAVGWSSPPTLGCAVDGFELVLCDASGATPASSPPSLVIGSEMPDVTKTSSAKSPVRETHLLASEINLQLAADLGPLETFSGGRRVVAEQRVDVSSAGELIMPDAEAMLPGNAKNAKVYPSRLRRAIAALADAASRRRCTVLSLEGEDQKTWSSDGVSYQLCLRPLLLVSSDTIVDGKTSRMATTVLSVAAASCRQDVACRAWLRRLTPSFGQAVKASLPAWGAAKPEPPAITVLDEHTTHVRWSPPSFVECTYSRAGLFADRLPIKAATMSKRVLMWPEATQVASSGDDADRHRLIERVKDLCDTWEDDGTRPTYDVAPAALDGPHLRSVVAEYLVEVRPLPAGTPVELPSDGLSTVKLTRRDASDLGARFPYLPTVDCETLQDTFEGSRFFTIMADTPALTKADEGKVLTLARDGGGTGEEAERRVSGQGAPTALVVDGESRAVIWQHTDAKPPAGSLGSGAAESTVSMKLVVDEIRRVILIDGTSFNVPSLAPHMTCNWLESGVSYGWRVRARATIAGWSEWSEWAVECCPRVEAPEWPLYVAAEGEAPPRDPLATGGVDVFGTELLALEAKSQSSLAVRWKAPVVASCEVVHFEVQLRAPAVDGVEFTTAADPKAEDVRIGDGSFELGVQPYSGLPCVARSRSLAHALLPFCLSPYDAPRDLAPFSLCM